MSERRRTMVDPAEWFAKVESLQSDLRAMTTSRDNWQQKYRDERAQRKAAEAEVERLKRELDAMEREFRYAAGLDD